MPRIIKAVIAMAAAVGFGLAGTGIAGADDGFEAERYATQAQCEELGLVWDESREGRGCGVISPYKTTWYRSGTFFAGAEAVWSYIGAWNRHCRGNEQGTHMVIRRAGTRSGGAAWPFSQESSPREFLLAHEQVQVTRMNGLYKAEITFETGLDRANDGYPHIDCSGFINGDNRALLRVSDANAYWIDGGALRKYRHPCQARTEAWNYLLIVGHKREVRIIDETSRTRARGTFGYGLALDAVRTCDGVNEATHRLDPITFTTLD